MRLRADEGEHRSGPGAGARRGHEPARRGHAAQGVLPRHARPAHDERAARPLHRRAQTCVASALLGLERTHASLLELYAHM